MKPVSIVLLSSFLIQCILSPFFPLISQIQDKPRLTIGIIPFNAEGVEDYEAVTISNRLHSKVVESGQFIVIEIDRVKNIIDELNFHQTGFIRDDYIIQIGQQLGARWMVAGSVGKIGDTYTIDVRTIDIKTRRTLFTVTRNYSGFKEGLLNLVGDIANELASKSIELVNYGNIMVKSEPTNANVYINDKYHGTTNTGMIKTPVGLNKILIQKNGYSNWNSTVQIKPMEDEEIIAQLRREYTLSIISMPSDATIYINNRQIDRTPFLRKIPTGEYKISLQKSGYLTWSQIINLNADKNINAILQLDDKTRDKISQIRKRDMLGQETDKKKKSKTTLYIIGAVVIGGVLYFSLNGSDHAKNDEGSISIDIPGDI